MKYILYLTTNIVNGKIYVGIHKTENPDIFDGYIGCGVKIYDRYSYKYGDWPFVRAVRKYGVKKFIRATLRVFNDLNSALKAEREIVTEEFINRKDTYNVTIGGGMPPIVNKTIYQYNIEGIFVKEWPSITEAALSLKVSGSSIGKAIKDKTPSCNCLWTEEKLNSLDVKQFNINRNTSKCYLYDKEGIFIKEFNSHKECAEYTNVTKQEISKSVNGEYFIRKKYIVSYRKQDKIEISKPNFRQKPVYQYSLDGEFIAEYDSVKSAKEATGINLNIAHACRSLGQSGGFQWSYVKVDRISAYKNKTIAKIVGMYDKNWNLLRTFKSASAAIKEFGSNVANVLIGKRKTAYGYNWKYINN